MAIYICPVCSYKYEEAREGAPWDALEDDWVCPVCGAPKSVFVEEAVEPPAASPTKTALTTSDVLAATMTAWGVRWVFGMVGHSNLGLAEAIRKEVSRGRLSSIGIRHEGAASFACSAYGKLTGRPAACLAIAGPGATNLLTGLWDANVDRSPVLALTGQVQTQVLGPGAFQEVDLRAAFGQVAGWQQMVLSTSRPAELMSLALKSAIVNRGVSQLIVPDEVQTLEAADPAPGSPEGRLMDRRIAPPAAVLAAAVERLASAKRPVVIVGHGARFAMDSIIPLAERLNSPVITTFKAKGQIPDAHPLACGVVGRSGIPVSARFMGEADLLLVFGASFSQHSGILKDRPTIQVDFDPMALARFHAVALPVQGEIGVTAALLTDALDGRPLDGEDPRTAVAGEWAAWRAEKARRAGEDAGRGLASAAVFEALSEAAPTNALIAVDVGNNTYSFGRYFECRDQRVIMSGYLGSIGFALPAAMGAWAAAQEEGSPVFGRPVISISGDGGFAQYMGELLTAVKYGMNITHILLNNRELGKISKEQRDARLEVWQTDLHNLGFAEFAEACGAKGIRVTSRGDLKEVLAAAIAHPGPALVEIPTDPELV